MLLAYPDTRGIPHWSGRLAAGVSGVPAPAGIFSSALLQAIAYAAL